ncbi:MAG TPA: hypothetical protein VNL18_05185, partial [Gemmatimonadales bacterium]|nr:hypothetical protein [Gemmatimonadales bacterium]
MTRPFRRSGTGCAHVSHTSPLYRVRFIAATRLRAIARRVSAEGFEPGIATLASDPPLRTD